MSDLLKKLQERRLNAWEQAKEILERAEAEGRGLEADEESAWAKANEDINALDARMADIVAAEQRAADTAAAFDAIQSRPTVRAEAPGEEAALRAFIKGETRSYQIEARDLSKGTATAGGNTVPTTFSDRFWAHLIETANIVNYATVLSTASGENIEIPTTTSHSSGALITEGSTLTESDPAFAKRTLGAYKYGLSIQVSSELLADSAIDLTGYLAMQAGRAVGNALGANLITGTGSSQPTGIMTSTTLGVTGGTGVSGAFTADNLIDLHYSVIAPYRNSASCGWLMRDATLATVRKLKGSDNNYLWVPGLAGAPDTILGKPVVTDPNVAAVALSARSVAFGDLSAYYVRLAGGVRFERSDEFAFQNDLVTFRCIVRGDGILVDQTGAVKHFVGAGT